MPYEIRMNMFLIKCSDINGQLCERFEQLIDAILTKVHEHVFVKMAPEISATIKTIQDETGAKSTTSKELVKNEKRLEEVKNVEHKRLKVKYADMIEWLIFLNNNPYRKGDDEGYKPVQVAFKLMNQIQGIIDACEQKLKQDRLETEQKCLDEMKKFAASIEQTKAQVNALKEKQNVKVAEQCVQQFEEVNKDLKRLSDDMKRIHEQQTDLEMMLTEYPQIEELKTTVKPYEELWKLTDEFYKKYKRWKTDVLSTLVPDEIEADFKKMQRASNKLVHYFDSKSKNRPKGIAQQVQRDLETFKIYLPVIRALCNPGLQERHKQLIGEVIYQGGTEVFDPSTMTADSCAQLRVTDHTEQLEEISDKASKEWSNEKTMGKMKEEWEPLEFTAVECPGKDSYILAGEAVEAIQTALDDHVIKT